jgi:hypothetical protein
MEWSLIKHVLQVLVLQFGMVSRPSREWYKPRRRLVPKLTQVVTKKFQTTFMKNNIDKKTKKLVEFLYFLRHFTICSFSVRLQAPQILNTPKTKTPWPLVRKRTIPTDRLSIHSSKVAILFIHLTTVLYDTQNIVIDGPVFLLRVQEIPGSNLGLETKYF